MMKDRSRLLPWLMWPALALASWWSWGEETSALFHLMTIWLIAVSIFLVWWRRRYYIASISLLFISLVGSFAYLQSSEPAAWAVILIYCLLLVALWMGCLAAFQTYRFSWRDLKVAVYIFSIVFILLEFFWLLAVLSADPLVKAALVVGVFHFLFAVMALEMWHRLKALNFRLYIIGAVVYFTIFIRLL